MLLKKILFRSKNNIQVLISSVGVFLGLTALLLSVLIWNDIQSFQNSDEEMFGPNSLIIQKRVTKFTSIGLNSTEFTNEDIKLLESKDFIEKVSPFNSANYQVGISEYPGDGLPAFYADMFFQSIPDEFIDVDTEWSWDEGSDFVPIILPRDFLMLINYGIAESQGMPQISEDLLAVARLKIHMNGKFKNGVVTGKVVGFSHKISSILVPDSFLSYSNLKYGDRKKKLPQRLFISIQEDSFGELERLMEEMNLDINKSALDITKIKTFVKVIVSLFIIFSIVIIILSILSFMQYIQLILNKSKTEIVILLKQGYTHRKLLNVLINYFNKIFGIISALSLVVVFVLKFLVINIFLEKYGVLKSSNEILYGILMTLMSIVLFILLNFVSTKVTLRKIDKR
jgi:hypothetical protein